MGDTQFNSFQTGFLRKTDASHGVFVLERASELAKEWKTLCSRHSWTSRRPLTTCSTLSQPQHYNRKGCQSIHSRYSTNGGPKATLKSAWQASPVTNASPSRGVSRKKLHSRLQYLWLFLIMSWGTWTQAGGRWTVSTSRASLTLTTSVCWRQTKKILRSWSRNASKVSWLQAWTWDWTKPFGPAQPRSPDSERRRTRAPFGRENHMCWRKKSPLQQQWLSDDQQAPKKPLLFLRNGPAFSATNPWTCRNESFASKRRCYPVSGGKVCPGP